MFSIHSSHERRRVVTVLALVVAAMAVLTGCAGLETGNGEQPTPPEGQTTEVVLALGLADGELPLQAFDATGAKIVLTAASLEVSELRVDLAKVKPGGGSDTMAEPVDCEALALELGVTLDCGPQNRLTIDGPLTALLLDQTWSPSLAALLLPAGSYKGVRATTTGGLLEGQIDTGTQVLNFSLPIEGTKTLNFRDDQGIKTEAGEPLTLTLHVDLSEVFTDVDLATCVTTRHAATLQNPVVVDQTQPCAQVVAKIGTALERATSLQ